MKNNKGLSTIVATLIIILLVLVAVGIIWVVVRNVIQSGSQQIDISSKCMEVEVRATKAVCASTTDGGNDGVCNVTISRSAGGEAIGGVKLIFYNDDGDSNNIMDVSGNINPLATQTQSNLDTTIVNASKVEVVPYFLDDSGNEQLCGTTNTYNF